MINMPSAILSDSSSLLMAKLMELSHERQGVLANNMANANTPGYIRMDVDFRQELAKRLADNDPASVSAFRAEPVEDETRPPGKDGNNVVLPTEMNAMMQNSLLDGLLTKAFATKLNILRTAIDGGVTG